MKQNKTIAFIVGAVLVVMLALFMTTYSLRFNEVAVVTTFGEASGPGAVEREPGLHFKLPVPIQSAKTFDRRLQVMDTRLETQATKDGRQVVVQAFALWKINDQDAQSILNFDRAYGSIDRAKDDIEARMRSAVSAISQFEFDELIGENSRLDEAEDAILQRLASGEGNESLAGLGVEIVEVGLSQVILPIETTQSVIERMKDERDTRAEIIRIQGESDYQRIISEGAEKADRIRAFADRLATQIRAQGDSLASAAIKEMTTLDPEFATFLIWLDALEQVAQNNSTYFIPTNFAPFHLLNVGGQVGRIPQPAGPRPGEPGVAAEPLDDDAKATDRLIARDGAQDDQTDESEGN